LKRILILVLFSIAFLAPPNAQSSSKRLFIFAGSASKPATGEVIKAFQKKLGIPVDITFGGSGFVLSQMSQRHFPKRACPYRNCKRFKKNGGFSFTKDLKASIC